MIVNSITQKIKKKLLIIPIAFLTKCLNISPFLKKRKERKKSSEMKTHVMFFVSRNSSVKNYREEDFQKIWII